MKWHKFSINKEQILIGTLNKITETLTKIRQEFYFNIDFKEVVFLIDDYNFNKTTIYISQKALELPLYDSFIKEHFSLSPAKISEAKRLSFLFGDNEFAQNFIKFRR